MVSLKAYENARKAGFSNINLDLMYGIPTMSFAQLQSTVRTLIMLAPEHVSTYSLIVNKGTRLYAMLKKQNYDFESYEHDDLVIQQFDYILNELNLHGYNRYEISNFSKKGFESVHNSAYWQMKETLGAGIGAVYTRKHMRIENTYSYKKYNDCIVAGKLPIGNVINLSKDDMIFEKIMMGLRLASGIKISEFKDEFGVDIYEEYSSQIAKFVDLGYMNVGESIRLNNKGMNISNAIICDFVKGD